jgi:hypothetical protein
MESDSVQFKILNWGEVYKYINQDPAWEYQYTSVVYQVENKFYHILGAVNFILQISQTSSSRVSQKLS